MGPYLLESLKALFNGPHPQHTRLNERSGQDYRAHYDEYRHNHQSCEIKKSLCCAAL